MTPKNKNFDIIRILSKYIGLTADDFLQTKEEKNNAYFWPLWYYSKCLASYPL